MTVFMLVSVYVGARDTTTNTNMNTNPNQLLLYKLYFTMSISNWLVFRVSVSVCLSVARAKHRTDTHNPSSKKLVC